MSRPDGHQSERLHELLVDRATVGLTSEELTELIALAGDAEDLSFDVAAAALQLAMMGEEVENLPASARTKLERAASTWRTDISTDEGPPMKLESPFENGGWRGPAAWLGWIAATACLVFAASVWQSANVAPSSESQLREFLKRAPADLVRLDWSAAADEDAQGAAGEVLWSNDAQEGYMRLRGLAVNDPTVEQYQLWIFDEAHEHPIDGGVFDMPEGAASAVVPIDPKLTVTRPTLFAITIENPGGVVVSKRERIALTAAASGRSRGTPR